MIGKLRFIVLQTILAAALAALWFNDSLKQVIAGEGVYFIAGVLLVAATGLAGIFMGRKDYAEWLCVNLLIVGVVGMQIGLSVAMVALAASLTGGDATAVIAGFIGAVGVALHVSIAALASLLWLRITLRFA